MEASDYIGDYNIGNDEANPLGEIVKLRPDITYNNTRTYANGKKAPDGIEIRFGNNKPVIEVRDAQGSRLSVLRKSKHCGMPLTILSLVNSAEKLATTEIDVDDARYEKLSFLEEG